MRHFLLASCIALFMGATAQATIYVDPDDGNDSNAGTSIEAPWKSLQKVQSADSSYSLPGQTILGLSIPTLKRKLSPA